jgi:hypothetical protein
MAHSPKRRYVGTLGEIARAGRTLTLNCGHCDDRAEQDIVALIAAYGVDCPLQQIVDRAVCQPCGRRNISVTLNGGRGVLSRASR